jgi:hypothetical protein
MLTVVMLSVVMLSVVMLSVVMLSDLAPLILMFQLLLSKFRKSVKESKGSHSNQWDL